MTAIVMTLKKANPRENRTAVVQVHSKFLTIGSARSFALTSTFGTFMRPPSPRPSSRSPRLRALASFVPGPGRIIATRPRVPARSRTPLGACESVHKAVGHYRRTGRGTATHRACGAEPPARAPTLNWRGDRGARRLGPGRSGVVVGPGSRVRRGGDLVRIAVRVPAGPRLPLVRGRGRGARGTPAGGADPAVHRRVRRGVLGARRLHRRDDAVAAVDGGHPDLGRDHHRVRGPDAPVCAAARVAVPVPG